MKQHENLLQHKKLSHITSLKLPHRPGTTSINLNRYIWQLFSFVLMNFSQ